MDLMRLLRSLEEFLYELVGWLVFYPRTFWRILWHPGEMARYTVRELAQPERQFQSTISPVLMLILSVVLAHVLEITLKVPLPPGRSPMRPLLLGSEQGLLLTRSAVFCIYALGAALGTLHQERKAITRDTLRGPFSVQAFLACPFVVLFSAGELLARTDAGRLPGGILLAAAIAWYLSARVIAYRTLHHAGWPRALVLVASSFLATTLLLLAALAPLLL